MDVEGVRQAGRRLPRDGACRAGQQGQTGPLVAICCRASLDSEVERQLERAARQRLSAGVPACGAATALPLNCVPGFLLRRPAEDDVQCREARQEAGAAAAQLQGGDQVSVADDEAR